MTDFLTQAYYCSQALAALGLLLTAAVAAYRHMTSADPMAKKDAWETLMYAIIGAMLVMLAPMLAQVLG